MHCNKQLVIKFIGHKVQGKSTTPLLCSNLNMKCTYQEHQLWSYNSPDSGHGILCAVPDISKTKILGTTNKVHLLAAQSPRKFMFKIKLDI